MQLKIEHIIDKSKFWNEINMLAKEAFPVEEYLSPDELLKMSKESNLDFLLLTDNNQFVGFIVMQIYKNMAYLFFLAINSNCRSKGYGSYAIKALKNAYPGKQQVVDLEKIDKTASNYKQRLKRKEFYLKNGYKETGLFLSYLGVDYEVLCMDNNFDEENFKNLMSSIKVDNFDPQYFRN